MRCNGIGISDWDCPIYHVFARRWFIDLLKSGQNALVPPSFWDDPFENFLLTCVAVTPDGERVGLEGLAKRWFGQCWTKNRDSDAMWRIYSPYKDGICVATTISKLFSSYYDATDEYAQLKYFIGEVEYVGENEIQEFLTNTSFSEQAIGGQGDSFAKTLCIKRREFDHESEVRLLHHDISGAVCDDDVAKFDFDVNEVLTEVIVDPRLSETCAWDLMTELKSLGCRVPMSQSGLYKLPKREIPL